jgi:hypothetical protein
MYCFTAVNCEIAPLNEIQFLRELQYSEINKTIFEAMIGLKLKLRKKKKTKK